MPPPPRPPIPPTIAKVVLGGTVYTHAWRNIFYLAIGGSGIAQSDITSLAGSIGTDWGTRFISQVSVDTALTSVDVTYVPSVGTELRTISTVSKIGTVTGTVQDASASYLLNWNVNKYYRGGHPRWYMPGVASSVMTNGSIVSSAARTALGTAATNYLNDINALTTTNITSVVMGTLSWVHNKAWRTPPVHFPFVSVSVAGTLAQQRRRIHS